SAAGACRRWLRVSSAMWSGSSGSRGSSPSWCSGQAMRSPTSPWPTSCSLSCTRALHCRADWRTAESAASLPPKASSRASWLARDSSAWCSCWPWISTSSAASSESWAMVAGRPLIQAREPPSARSVRRSWHSPPSSNSASRSQASASGASSSENSATSSARSAPWRTMPLSARAPDRKPRASTSSDLPAPVSPEITVRPASKSIAALVTTAKSRMARWMSTARFCLARRRPNSRGTPRACAATGPGGPSGTVKPNPADDTLDPRARRLLRTLIARYIQDGAPVGSQTLARHAGLDVSPATIRNILADLEDVGLLSSPHTSAGRIPTAQGYRVFVDSLLQVKPLRESEVARLREELPAGSDTQSLLGGTSELLSAMSRFVGVVSAPRRDSFAFRHIDFVPVGAKRVLAILVFADNDVQNRIIHTRRAYDAGELERVANYLNQHFAGRPLGEIRAVLLRDLQAARDEMQVLLAHTVDLAGEALRPEGTGAAEDMLLAGQTRLMGVQDLSDLDRLRELFEAFARKREILQLLERTIAAQGVQVFIGEETGLAPLESVSL